MPISTTRHVQKNVIGHTRHHHHRHHRHHSPCAKSIISFSKLESSKRMIINITTGSKGKAATSPEEDILLTRQVIMKHVLPFSSSSYNDNDHHESTGRQSPLPIITQSTLDTILSKFTYAFPFFVLSSAILGSLRPSTLLWVNQGNIISILLALVMIAMGMTLETKDFTKQASSWKTMIPVGVACQYGIMPLLAWLVGHTFLLPSSIMKIHNNNNNNVAQPQDIALFLGLILVGSAPGGTASNLVSLIAGADLALSVILTAISTLLASFITPLLVQVLVGKTIRIQGKTLCITTAQVVLLPVLLGMILKAKVPKVAQFISRFASFASVLFVSLICGGVVSSHADLIHSIGVIGTNIPASSSYSYLLLPKILTSVFLLHTLGFFMGYIIPRFILRFDEKTARTMSIETGMQNSALAVVLAKSVGVDPISCLPGAFSATMHSCLGSLLAVYWRYVDKKNKNQQSTTSILGSE